MTPNAVKLRISPPVGDNITPGRGFYQIEEDALYVQVGAFKAGQRYFSYLESESVHLEIDGSGELIFVEVSLPRHRWSVDSNLVSPADASEADVRWLDFRETIKEPSISRNESGTTVRILFSSEAAVNSLRIAENVILEATAKAELVSIWITDIIDDKAGQELASFRHSMSDMCDMSDDDNS